MSSCRMFFSSRWPADKPVKKPAVFNEDLNRGPELQVKRIYFWIMENIPDKGEHMKLTMYGLQTGFLSMIGALRLSI